MTLPVIQESISAKPYLANEFFVDSDEGEYNQNRLALGLKSKPYGRLAANTYYMWAARPDRDWDGIHIFGIKLGLNF